MIGRRSAVSQYRRFVFLQSVNGRFRSTYPTYGKSFAFITHHFYTATVDLQTAFQDFRVLSFMIRKHFTDLRRFRNTVCYLGHVKHLYEGHPKSFRPRRIRQ